MGPRLRGKGPTFKFDTSMVEVYTWSGKAKGSPCWEQNEVYISVLCPKLSSRGREPKREQCAEQLLETPLAKRVP